MESNEREPSYYEVALTHRQLMIGLVVALATVVVAFFSGVWIGRGGSAPSAATQVADVGGGAAASQVDQITFFGEKKSEDRSAPPTPIAPKPTTSPPAGGTPPAAESDADALRKTLEAEMAANRVDAGGGAESAAPEPAPVAPGTRVARETAAPAKAPRTTRSEPSAAAPATPPAASATPAVGSLWIQVYSSTNRERANEIVGRLRRGGFAVRLLEPAASGGNVRVRVGPYSDRPKADRAAARLRREHKLDTWVTDTP